MSGGTFAGLSTGASSNPAYFSDGFESGDFSAWTQSPYTYVSPLETVDSTPSEVHSGTYSGKLHFLLCGVQTPDAATLSYVSGGSLGARTYYVQYTYESTHDSTHPDMEGLPSNEQNIAIPADNRFKITSPAAQNGIDRYYVYISTSSGNETKEAGPINIGTDWTEPTTGLVGGGASVPSTNEACGTDNHGTAGYPGATSGAWYEDFRYSQTGELHDHGADHVFVRGYLRFHFNPGDYDGVQRKLFYLWSPPECGGGSCFWFVFGGVAGSKYFDFDASPSPGNEVYVNSAYDHTDYQCSAGDPEILCNSVLYGPFVGDDWYYVEVEIQLNTVTGGVGNHDGIVRVWVQKVTANNGAADPSPVLILSTANAVLRNDDWGFTKFSIGQQADRTSYNVIDEDRFWDDVVISGSQVGP
jgi:hypothetical protein